MLFIFFLFFDEFAKLILLEITRPYVENSTNLEMCTSDFFDIHSHSSFVCQLAVKIISYIDEPCRNRRCYPSSKIIVLAYFNF